MIIGHDGLDKRWCDLFEDSTNTQTVREWIHDARKYLYCHDDISDEYLDGLSSLDLDELIDDLDYLLGK